ncbi:hypothetical protein CISIN_1g0221302mg, partial [Citrus sinensis]
VEQEDTDGRQKAVH